AKVTLFTSLILFFTGLLKPDSQNVRAPPLDEKRRFWTRNKSLPIYSHEEIRSMTERLSGLTNKSEAEKLQHIEAINTKCPFCGSELVLRKGKYGSFWGCSTYPKCKFTRQVK
ncbi:topoisomerase DNA-binding C4 zinc finger domain-containing protein, partial [Dysosmobacter sp.]|uniref:topoisomerase DNA-binding C4 zinc finger domain-containing protein n=1 Tax=Dysosmobacter sp. TaxID=2591382 RepID=UPI003AB3668E